MERECVDLPFWGYLSFAVTFQMFGTFMITQADAKAYMYAISPLRRVHRFRDIQVNLYI